MNKPLRVASTFLTAGLLLAVSACGGSSPAGSAGSAAKKVNFTLNFAASGFHAGFAVAQEKGYYQSEGLNVNLQQGQGSTTTAQLVASGQVDIGYADAAAVMPLIAKGAPIKVIATMNQVSPNAVTALTKTGLKSVADLKGRSLGVPSGSSQIPMVPVLLKANGLTVSDIKEVSVPSTSLVPLLLQGKVDAILGSVDAYGIQLDQQGAKTDNYLMADNGVATVSVSIIARDDYLKANSDTVRKFIAASLKGWNDALNDEPTAIDDLIKVFPQVKKAQALPELKAEVPLYCQNGAKFVGKAEPQAWAKATSLLVSVGLLPASSKPTDFYTYDYLPQQMRAC